MLEGGSWLKLDVWEIEWLDSDIGWLDPGISLGGVTVPRFLRAVQQCAIPELAAHLFSPLYSCACFYVSCFDHIYHSTTLITPKSAVLL